MKASKVWIITVILLAVMAVVAPKTFTLTEADFTTDGKGTILHYEGFDTEVVIPARIGGKPVTAIGSEAFQSTDLTSVTLPNGVTSIGARAFWGNKLTVVVIPDSVQRIGNDAFQRNPLTDITLGKGIISIALNSTVTSSSFAFPLDKVERITLAEKSNFDVSLFGKKILYEYMCNDLKAGTFTLDRNWKPQTKETDNFRYIEMEYGLVITQYTGESNRLVIPEQIDGKPVKFIAKIREGITGVRIPATIIGIGSSAFEKCPLSTLELPNSVVYIGDRAFDESKLASVTFGSGVTYIGKWAFNLNQMTSITIPNSVVYIGYEAFYTRFIRLTSIAIGANVTMGDNAFNGGRGGLTVYYNGNGKKAGVYTFSGTEWSYKAR